MVRRDSASSEDRSPSPSPSESRVHLPPETRPDYNLEAPNVLVDRVLGLHTRPTNSRKGSWMSAFADEPRSKTRTEREGQEHEEEPLLDSEAVDDEQDGHADGHQTSAQRRTSRSRSQSTRRSLPWYKRPSPMWFIPGSFIMALTMGMTISPKIEIYYQLICRVMGPEESGTTLPPPVTDIGLGPPLPHIGDSTVMSYSRSRDEREAVGSFVEQATTSAAASQFDALAQEGDTWLKQCHKSHNVQKAVSSLATTLSLSMGLLSALTTGFWGSVSDRRGRKPVIVTSLMGMLCMDAVFLITVNYHSVVGYRFLLLGPVLDGLAGGYATAQATVYAYLSDCTDSGSRARIFAVLGGIMFAGLALGPVFGSFLIRQIGSVLAPFYGALLMHLLYVLVVTSVFPESLTKARQYAARHRQAEDARKRREQDEVDDARAREKGTMAVVWNKSLRLAGRPWGFLSPLKLMLPRKRHIDELEEDKPGMDIHGDVQSGWDFSLIKIGIAMAAYGVCMAIIQFKLFYTSYTFNWGSAENAYYLSFISICRVVVLLVILPLVIKIFHRKAPLPSEPRPETADSAGDPLVLTADQKEWDKQAKWLRTVHDAHFDLLLARLSIAIDVIGFALFALNGGSVGSFLFATAFASFGGGAAAAIQSLALAHASPRDAGRLFASLSVLSSVASSVIGPVLFGAVFNSTIATLPEAIFWVAAGLYSISLVSMLSVRLRKREGVAGALGESEAEAGRRGRSSTRKAGSLSS